MEPEQRALEVPDHPSTMHRLQNVDVRIRAEIRCRRERQTQRMDDFPISFLRLLLQQLLMLEFSQASNMFELHTGVYRMYWYYRTFLGDKKFLLSYRNRAQVIFLH